MNALLPLSRRSFMRTTLGAVLAPGVTARCRSVSTTATYDGARLTARPTVPELSPVKGAITALGLGSPRDGYLYVPESYAPDLAMPLFVALHGAGGEGRNWASYPDRADAHGMIVLAPDSRDTTWDLVRGGFGRDVAFLDAALTHVFERCRVDPARIALGGFSDGASYALSLGVANGDLFSHLVAYSPGFYQPGEPITGEPRIFASHGRRDRILSFSRTSELLVPLLRAAGYDVTFLAFDGDHEVPATISEAALTWFLDE
jgi:phospholipase/carboxylesterase